jgi:hypothetical protein
MKLGRLNPIGVATLLSPSVIASAARQSSALVGQSGLLRRCAPRNDGAGRSDGGGGAS